jgi:multidrug efflux pump subunit AcrA (membrane-fusion protein)
MDGHAANGTADLDGDIHSNGAVRPDGLPETAAIPPRNDGDLSVAGDHVELLERLAQLEGENEQLRQALEQARERLKQAEKSLAQAKVREQEYESLLEEKSEVIRQLHAQVHGPERPPDARMPAKEDLLSLQAELEREREQLRLDEEALMAEMRNMEVQMARERADLARQRSELQRLHSELRHELEVASRDAALRERLAPLYRLQEEMLRRRSDAPRPPTAAPPTAQPAPEPPNGQRSSGFFRRMFRRDQD